MILGHIFECAKMNKLRPIVLSTFTSVIVDARGYVGEDLPAERKLCRGVMILAKLCKRRGTGSCRYEKVVETLKPDIQQVSCQNARESISSFLRHLWVSITKWFTNAAMSTSITKG